jgi:hypothetical protein
MSKPKHSFTADQLAAMVADINMALVGVAQKYKVDLSLDGNVEHKTPLIHMVLTAVPEPIVTTTKVEPVTARVAAMIAALHSAQPKHFPDLALTSTYVNGDHSYKIIGFNSKAREHKLLLKNVESGELFRFSIEQVTEFKAVKAKRTKK